LECEGEEDAGENWSYPEVPSRQVPPLANDPNECKATHLANRGEERSHELLPSSFYEPEAHQMRRVTEDVNPQNCPHILSGGSCLPRGGVNVQNLTLQAHQDTNLEKGTKDCVESPQVVVLEGEFGLLLPY